MTDHSAAWLAWSLWGLFAGSQVLTVVLIWNGPATLDEAFGVLMFGFATVGALVAWRRPRNAVGWLILAIAMAFVVQVLGDVYAQSPSYPAHTVVAWFASWSWYVWMILAGVFLPLVYPTGRLLTPRWRPVLWLGLAAMAASVAGAAFAPGRLDVEAAVQNPLAASGATAELARGVARLGDALTALAFLLAAVSLAVRLRRSRGVERQQLKWFAFVGLLAVVGLALALVQVITPGEWRDPVGAVGWFTFLFASILGVPVATGIAILRHRLYDIDVVINRTLVYGALTAMLVATYLGSVLVLRLVLSPVTGESDLAVAGSTLAVAALVRPLRARIQTTVDRHFYRARYDASRTLEAFSGRLRHELDLEAAGADLIRVVSQTLHPVHVSLWLREAGR